MVRAARRQTPYAYEGVPRDGTPILELGPNGIIPVRGIHKKERGPVYYLGSPKHYSSAFFLLAKSTGPPEEHLVYAPEVTRLIIPNRRPVCPPKVFNGQLYTFL